MHKLHSFAPGHPFRPGAKLCLSSGQKPPLSHELDESDEELSHELDEESDAKAVYTTASVAEESDVVVFGRGREEELVFF